MRQAASLRDGILPSAGAATVWSFVIVFLLAAGSPPLQACDGGTAVPDPESNPGLVADCTVLLGLRDELAATASLNWDTGLAITDWEGINVSGSPGRVSRLDLIETALTGTIPPELGRLSQLQELHLFNNELTGPIPPELGQLSRLQYLRLYNNQLTGPIPPELGQLSRLWWLHLDHNQLMGPIPAELGQLLQLGQLGLEHNQLTGPIPAELGQLSRLWWLHLENNQLTGPIPPELGQLSRLEELDLRNNELTGPIPSQLGQLTQLRVLHLFNNELTGPIPSQLGQLTQLRVLHLFNNELTGPIPSQLGQLSQLTGLLLFNNRLTGEIPSELGQLSQLQELPLFNNELTGPIPPQLGQLSQLQELPLYNNQLTGPIPPQLGQLSQLQYLTLFNNQLTGEIPPELGQLSQLQYLTLHNNQLSGEIPVELGQLSQLWSLALDHNQLTDEIPSQLGQLSQLRWLTLDHNELTGEIPPELGQLSQLRWLHLQHNELTGPIPPQLGQLSNLTQFSFRGNRLTGPVPSELSHLPEGPVEEFALDFAHFANGASITSGLVLVNVGTDPIRPALYFYDKGGDLIAPGSVVEITGDLEVQEDGSLSVRTEIEPLGELTLSTHGRENLVTGSVTVDANGPIGGVLRFDLPSIGVAGVGASLPLRDAIFPARRRAGGISTAAAIHNPGEEAMGVNCRLMKAGAVLEEVEIPLAANGQEAQFIEQMFTGTDTADFVGSVRCTAPGLFTGVAVELDYGNRIFTTLPVVPVDRAGGSNEETALDFAHFANGDSITSSLVFVNVATHPIRPALYFYDKSGNLIDAESVVDVTGDLEVTGDGSLSVRTEIEPLGELTLSTHGRENLVTGSVTVDANGPIGGVLRFDLPSIGVAGVGASQPVQDALFPARRQAGGVSTAAAIHNPGEEAMVVSCRLMKAGVVLEEVEIPLEANGQEAQFIEQMFTGTDTSNFVGSVRCTAPGLFTGVAVELDYGNRIFTTLPVVPVEKRTDRE